MTPSPDFPFAPPLLSPRRILVVDDDIEIQKLLTIGLQRTGYDVECAGDGEAGWEALQVKNFDLLITDHNMPRLSGLGLLRKVRAAPLTLPAIMLSGNIPEKSPDLAELLSPGALLAKPFSWAKLLELAQLFLHPNLRSCENLPHAASHDFRGHITG